MINQKKKETFLSKKKRITDAEILQYNKDVENAHRTELKKYYKEILTCKKCDKIYGNDQDTKVNTCPQCSYEKAQHQRSKKVLNEKLTIDGINVEGL